MRRVTKYVESENELENELYAFNAIKREIRATRSFSCINLTWSVGLRFIALFCTLNFNPQFRISSKVVQTAGNTFDASNNIIFNTGDICSHNLEFFSLVF